MREGRTERLDNPAHLVGRHRQRFSVVATAIAGAGAEMPKQRALAALRHAQSRPRRRKIDDQLDRVPVPAAFVVEGDKPPRGTNAPQRRVASRTKQAVDQLDLGLTRHIGVTIEPGFGKICGERFVRLASHKFV